jgi:hypothetical protein
MSCSLAKTRQCLHSRHILGIQRISDILWKGCALVDFDARMVLQSSGFYTEFTEATNAFLMVK